ncbi:cytochrome P450 2D26-like [Watersipora subatra]|uniref:cytochrome P450 2D26-like n=1 Tax=Watersipora subatra TaxID=2589382 RepID=UPI00355B1DAC
MDATTFLIGTATLLVLYYLLRRGDKSYPPGPFVFPIIGNLPQLFRAGSITDFSEYYRKKYGNVFSFEFAGGKRVVVSGYEGIRNLVVKNADYTSNRAVTSLSSYIKELMADTPGLIWAPFPHWKTLRSFAISTLREEGMGKAVLEPKILEEVELYIEHFILPNLGKPFDITHNLNQATSNVISQMLYARRFEYDDEEFNRLVAAANEGVAVAFKVGMIGNLPFGSLFVKSAIEREKYIASTVLQPTLQKYIDAHKATLDRDHPRDLTDRYLIHSEAAEGTNKTFFSDDNAVQVAIHLFIAGTETTATAMRWALLYMCLHPDVKKRVMEEIDDVIGQSRHVTGKDRVSLPYTDAVLLECLRKGNIAHVALPHVADKEMVIDGMTIPAGAELMLNMTSVLNDEAVFEEPTKFKPERYLTGDIALKKQRTIPFGLGRRVCPGESLAKMEFFIFFVTLLQRFDVCLPEGVTMTDKAGPNDTVVRAPPPYKLIFTARH